MKEQYKLKDQENLLLEIMMEPSNKEKATSQTQSAQQAGCTGICSSECGVGRIDTDTDHSFF